MERAEVRARYHQHFIYNGRSVLVSDLDGWVSGGVEGFFFRNTRFLSRLQVEVDGESCQPVAASPSGSSCFLAYASIGADEADRERTVYAELSHYVGEGLRTVLRVTNYSAADIVRHDVLITVDADFADSHEAQGGARRQTAVVERQEVALDLPPGDAPDPRRAAVRFRYCHPELDLTAAVQIEVSGSDVCVTDEGFQIPLVLEPGASAQIDLTVEPVSGGTRYPAPPARFGQGGPINSVRETLRRQIPVIRAANYSVTRAWHTAVDDLASLPLGLPEGPAAPMAGIPRFQQPFGRDMLTIGWQSAMAMPELLRDALRVVAATQGTETDDFFDEEPGKMLHQADDGPLAALGLNPYRRYYGDYATAPDFLVMVAQYLAWTGDMETVRELLPAARAAIEWLERHADLDGDGFLEYVTRSSQGLKNQGWKDHYNAIIYDDGRIVPNPIATCELQAWWYAGLELMAVVFFLAGDRRYALGLARKAWNLKRRFDAAFWMEDLGYYALALDPEKRQVRSIASNTVHLLATGIAPREKGRRVAQRAMQPDMFSGWGIRTLSRDHPAYNPFGYHLGSVWPVESAAFSFGFARYGCFEELHRLAGATFAASELFAESRLPEAISGVERDERHPHPGVYPKTSQPQGWSASAPVLLIQALLGMRAIAPLRLLLIDPHLPPWLPDLRLEGVRVGEARVDLEFRRTRRGKTRYRITGRKGSVLVLRQPVPQGPDATILGRGRAALASLVSFGGV